MLMPDLGLDEFRGFWKGELKIILQKGTVKANHENIKPDIVKFNGIVSVIVEKASRTLVIRPLSNFFLSI